MKPKKGSPSVPINQTKISSFFKPKAPAATSEPPPQLAPVVLSAANVDPLKAVSRLDRLRDFDEQSHESLCCEPDIEHLSKVDVISISSSSEIEDKDEVSEKADKQPRPVTRRRRVPKENKTPKNSTSESSRAGSASSDDLLPSKFKFTHAQKNKEQGVSLGLDGLEKECSFKSPVKSAASTDKQTPVKATTNADGLKTSKRMSTKGVSPAAKRSTAEPSPKFGAFKSRVPLFSDIEDQYQPKLLDIVGKASAKKSTPTRQIDPERHSSHFSSDVSRRTYSKLASPTVKSLNSEPCFEGERDLFDEVFNDDSVKKKKSCDAISNQLLECKDVSNAPSESMDVDFVEDRPPSVVDENSTMSLGLDEQLLAQMSLTPLPLEKAISHGPRLVDSYNRHFVTDIQSLGMGEVILILKEDGGDQREKTCVLRGFWQNTQVVIGDTIHITGDYDADTDLFIVDDQRGFVVVNPDQLVSTTSVVSTIFCLRKAVLNESFRQFDPGNKAMLFGNLLHKLFQEVLLMNACNEDAILKIIDQLLRQSTVIREIYGHKTSEAVVRGELMAALPHILSWFERYTRNLVGSSPASGSAGSEPKIVGICDIEENVWSPRFGIKGKIDVTVTVDSDGDRKVVPLELKSGKSTKSAEHQGQVTLYNLMASDQRPDSKFGYLLYFRDGDMTKVSSDYINQRGLMQLRNELAHYTSAKRIKEISQPVSAYSAKAFCDILPEPINNSRFCNNCPLSLPCTLLQKEKDDKIISNPAHAMATLIPDRTSHLSPSHMQYFYKWYSLLTMEISCQKRGRAKDIWCTNSQQREKDGGCVGGLKMTSCTNVDGSELFLHEFVRGADQPTISKAFAFGDMVAVTCEHTSQVAMATGSVLSQTDIAINVALDRDFVKRQERLVPAGTDVSALVYRLDLIESNMALAICFANLARLMQPDLNSTRLRKIVVDKEVTRQDNRHSADDISSINDILRSLNKPQQKAVFKSLTAKDYLLIKGNAGCGKTTFIVALVRVLLRLNMSVLLTSYTHSAVDNILIRLIDADVSFLRLGRTARIHTKVMPYTDERLTEDIGSVADLEEFYLSQRVVATTCLSTKHPIFGRRRFDVCIVDEASQVLQPACMGALFAADKAILIGDPLQLPPVVQSKAAKSLGLDESLFARLDSSTSIELNVQYRMNSEIMRLSNMLFYGGRLVCGNESISISTVDIPRADSFLSSLPQTTDAEKLCGDWLRQVCCSSLTKSAMFLNLDRVPAPEVTQEEKKSTVSAQNLVEARIACAVAYALVKCGVPPSSIGIISPFRGQVRLIAELIGSIPGLAPVESNTVDQYQGREKEVVIVSFVRSSNRPVEDGEILDDERRLNVALTRAKQKLVLLGSRSTLMLYPPLSRMLGALYHNQICNLPPGAHDVVTRMLNLL